MKKTTLLLLALAAFVSLKAQWVNDPVNNTFIANASSSAGEVYTSTDPISGDTYVQWTGSSSNGWSPTLQRLDFNGVPQWSDNGIHISGHDFASWSQGIAMAATTDGGVVSCFSNEGEHCVAVRINADGSFPWGEQGVTLFNGQGGSRTEVIAGNDGGVWALGADYDNSYLCYVAADGSMGPTITISDDGGKSCTFGLLVPGPDNGVLLVYEKNQWAYTYYYEKEIWVVGYAVDGSQIAPETQLMSTQTMGGSYCHYVVPDGANGGYAFIWHAGIGGAFNTYVFHFDQYGASTISDMNGIPVHSNDPANYYLSAYGTVDPLTNDLIIAFEQTDAYYQAESRIYVNRITSTGERLWGEGILVADNTGDNYSEVKVDAFEDGNGFCIIYNKGDGYNSTVEAKGYDKEGSPTWTTVMNSVSTPKAFCDNSTGFHLGQNVVAWVNSSGGGIYGQNIGVNGEMGTIEPPVITCLAPENFQGEYYYDEETSDFGALLTWTAPETLPLHYNLYSTDPSGCMTTIEIEPTETEFFDQTTCIGNVIYRLTAVYENCESDYALTPEGLDYLEVFITGIQDNSVDEIVDIVRVFNTKGQAFNKKNLDDLSNGVYILQGLTRDGRLISQKVIVNR